MNCIRSACVLLLLPAFALAGEFENGVEAMSKQDYDKAIVSFTACIREDSKNAAAFLRRGEAYAAKKDHDKAILDYTEHLRLKPSDFGYHDRAVSYIEKGEHDKAIADFTEAIKLNPKFTSAFANRGGQRLGKKEYDEALKDFTEAIRIDPTYQPAYLGRAGIYTTRKDVGKGIANWTELIHADPKNVYAFLRRGALYVEKKENDKGIADWSAVIQIDNKNTAAYHNLALELATSSKAKVRDGKKAVEYATKLCELTEWKVGMEVAVLAAAQAENGEFKEAVKSQMKAMELDKNLPFGKEHLKLYESNKPYHQKP